MAAQPVAASMNARAAAALKRDMDGKRFILW
jgi:hypothetical protein